MAAHTAADYAAMLRKLLPRGAIWTASPESNLARLLAAFGAELARLEGDAQRLLRELDPQQTLEALEDWEEELGLPDECFLAETIEARREAIVRKLQRGGFMNASFYVELARSHGYESAVVEEPHPFRAGSLTGDRVYSESFVYVFYVVVSASDSVRFFRAGSIAGERLREWDMSLECVMQKTKPAHTRVFIIYEEA